MEKDKNKIFQGALLDPLTAAILTIDETKHMCDELFEAEKAYLKATNKIRLLPLFIIAQKTWRQLRQVFLSVYFSATGTASIR